WLGRLSRVLAGLLRPGKLRQLPPQTLEIAQGDVDLIEGDLDIGGAQGLEDGGAERRLHRHGLADLREGNAQIEHQRAVAEILKYRARLRKAQHIGVIERARAQNGDHLFGIGGIRHADLDAYRHQRVAMRPVQHASRDQLRIGNDQAGAIEGLDFGGTHRDAAPQSLLVADDDPVTDLDWSLDQQNQARDKIVNDRLQAE